MATRKRWATALSGAAKHPRRSQRAAYDYIAAERAAFENGEHQCPWVQVYVDEGAGRGWEPYERVDFTA